MKTLRIIALGAVSAITLAFIGLVIVAEWTKAHRQYPSRENESAFLRTYDSHTVIKPFVADGYTPNLGRGSGGGAGVKSVTHGASFGEYFTTRKDLKGSLMLAVSRDISQRLAVNSAQILRESGSPSTGFHFDYKTGNTVGSIEIRPLAPEPGHRNMPLPDQLEDVVLNIDVSETWFPKGAPSEVRSSEIKISYDVAAR